MKSLRKRCTTTSLLIAVTWTWSSTNVRAQQTQPETPDESFPTDTPTTTPFKTPDTMGLRPKAPSASKTPEEIVVTGSRIKRKDLRVAAPLEIIDRESLAASGLVTVGDILQQITSQGNATNRQFANGGDGTTRINLRSLGAQRTLVLLNGRRHVYGGPGADASVDLDMIPIAMIDRVEVLKDGASAVYGSDAIGGVVNVVTRNDFEGVVADIYQGISGEGDGLISDLNVTGGTFSERGSFTLSVGRYDARPVLGDQREFSRDLFNVTDWNPESFTVFRGGSEFFGPNPTIFWIGEVGNQALGDLTSQLPPTGGLLINDPETGWRPFVSASEDSYGDNYNWMSDLHLAIAQERYHAFSTLDYRLFEDVHVFGEATYVNRRYRSQNSPGLLIPQAAGLATGHGAVSANSFYNPFGTDLNVVLRQLGEGRNRAAIGDVSLFRVVGGLRGTLADVDAFFEDWEWEAAYNFGRTVSTTVNRGFYSRDRVALAIGPSFLDTDGVVRCGTPGNAIEGCVPLNILAPSGSVTQDMIDYLAYDGVDKGVNRMQSVYAHLGGSLFELPSGQPLSVLVGGEYRLEAGQLRPDPLQVLEETTENTAQPTQGDFSVVEAYGELIAPLLADLPGVKALEFSGALRVSSYDQFGTTTNFKAGVRWEFITGLAARGTYATAFRAPSIKQLYEGNFDSFENVTDPCGAASTRTGSVDANCSADGIPNSFSDTSTQHRTRLGSNPELNPETANIVTAGLVYQPTFIEGFDLTLDYWRIDIDNAIQTLGAQFIVNSCYLAAPGERQYCDLVRRDASTQIISEVNDTVRNIGGLETWGIDFMVGQVLSLPRAGTFGVNVGGSYLGQYTAIQADREVEGKGVYDLGLVLPEWRLRGAVRWNLGGLHASLAARFVGGFEECENNACDAEITDPGPDGTADTADDFVRPTFRRTVDSFFTADVRLAYSFNLFEAQQRTTLALGVNNIFNAFPPQIFNTSMTNSDPLSYDYIGRYAYVQASVAF